MSLHRITPDNLEYFTIQTHPSRSYSSRLKRGSNGEVLYFTGSGGHMEEYTDNTGSVSIFSLNSDSQKEIYALSSYRSNTFTDESLETLRKEIVQVTSSNITSLIESYMKNVNETTSSLRTQAKVEILRFTPPFDYNSNTARKLLTIDHLMPYHRIGMDNCNFNFTNYNSLNLYHGDNGETEFPMLGDSVLLYPNPSQSLDPNRTDLETINYISQYGLGVRQPVSFDFWIKIKGKVSGEYTPGTILHLSGAYSVIVHSGSSRDANGFIDKYRLSFCLGETMASINPKDMEQQTSQGHYFTTDNSLVADKWHHVTIRMPGTNKINNGVGYIDIDSDINTVIDDYGDFDYVGTHVPTEDLSPDALCVGAFYNGPNLLADFFNKNSSLREGLMVLSDDTEDPHPSDYFFDCPFVGELHDVKIYHKFLTSEDIKYLQYNGPRPDEKLTFYLPPYFTEESPYRQFVGDHGGIIITPFQEKDGTSTMPFAPELSFGVGGHYPNLENYVRDFASGRYPRLINLSGGAIEPPNTVIQSANYFLYDSGSHVSSNKKRLYSILPCDHGNWIPNFSFLEGLSGSLKNGRYSNDIWTKDIASVNLRDILPDSYISSSKAITTSGSILNDVLGPRPDSLAESPGSSLTILHRTKDNSSNQVCFFDVSNLFYGNRIKPGTLVLTDPNLSGSDGLFGMRLMDNGRGSIYRADAKSGPYPTWSSCGNIFYDEGIIVLKHPSLYFFGKEGFDISFKGEQNVHVLTINAFARPMELLSSSNPTFAKFDFNSYETSTNDSDKKFVYITSVNIHDENLNVIARTHMAQPVIKRSGDKLLWRLRIDY